MLSQLVMDIYVHSDKVTILYDRTFTQELLGLEYAPKERQLYFHFTPGKLPFGVRIPSDISAALEHVDTVTLLQINLEEDEAVFGLEVPVKLI